MECHKYFVDALLSYINKTSSVFLHFLYPTFMNNVAAEKFINNLIYSIYSMHILYDEITNKNFPKEHPNMN